MVNSGMTWFNVLVAIFSAIVISAFSSWITVQLSSRRFRQERLWERKVAAYERVIEAFHHSMEFDIAHLNAEAQRKQLSESKSNELRERYKKAQEEIAKAINMSSFLLSEEANKRLKLYKKEADQAFNEENWYWQAPPTCTTFCERVTRL